MKTFHEFLRQSRHAEFLELPKFVGRFPPNIEKADFLLFEGAAVCEVKEIQAIDFPGRIQKLIGKDPKNFKRDAYNTINQALSKANNQIEDTKKTLDLLNAVGIVVIDQQIANKSSVLSVIDAADRKMLGGLVAVDAVLCLDVVNVFNDDVGNPAHIGQCVIRNSLASRKAAQICEQMVDEFLAVIGHPKKSLSISNAHHTWNFNKEKRFVSYEARFTSGI